MRLVVRALGTLTAALLFAGAPASAVPFSATLDVVASGPGIYGSPMFVSGAGSGTSQALVVTLPGSVFSGSDAALMSRFAVTGNGPGSFAGSALGGALPLRGSFRIEGLGIYAASTLVEVPLAIPVTYGYLGFGVGGTATLPVPGDPNAYWNVVHQSFGLGPKTASIYYVYSFHAPVGKAASMVLWYPYLLTYMVTGTDSRTPGGLGQVTLVSPTKVEGLVDGHPTMGGSFVLLGTLTFSFVPEPGTLVLLGAGAIGLGLAGRARRRSAGSR